MLRKAGICFRRITDQVTAIVPVMIHVGIAVLVKSRMDKDKGQRCQYQ